jgi:hypothetical protein
MTTQQTPAIVEKFLNDVTRKHAHDAQIKFKGDSWLMKALGFVLKPFNPDFTTRYVTTLGTTIYVPDGFFQDSDITTILEVISHETQHIIDSKQWGSFWFSLCYIFPQILSVLSLLSFGALVFHNNWWLLWLVSLVFLGPVPAYGRYKIELAGYRTAYIFEKFVRQGGGGEMIQVDNFVVENLSGQWYYFAWPFPQEIKNTTKSYSYLLEPRYVELITWLKTNGFISPPRIPQSG